VGSKKNMSKSQKLKDGYEQRQIGHKKTATTKLKRNLILKIFVDSLS
jgi:hypothetical protein